MRKRRPLQSPRVRRSNCRPPSAIDAAVTAGQPPPLAPLGRRERSQLSRGRKEIDARLDLHGMTQTRAHRVLFGFLQRAHSEGLTFVLVITGKGKMGAESERGVLRRQVPQWLSLPEFRSLVVGFEEAHIGHGGEGALYVRVRRSGAISSEVAPIRGWLRVERIQNGRTIPTRGISVTIQPKISGLSIIARYQRHLARGRQALDRMQDQEHADRPVRNPARIIEHDREHHQIGGAYRSRSRR